MIFPCFYSRWSTLNGYNKRLPEQSPQLLSKDFFSEAMLAMAYKIFDLSGGHWFSKHLVPHPTRCKLTSITAFSFLRGTVYLKLIWTRFRPALSNDLFHLPNNIHSLLHHFFDFISLRFLPTRTRLFRPFRETNGSFSNSSG